MFPTPQHLIVSTHLASSHCPFPILLVLIAHSPSSCSHCPIKPSQFLDPQTWVFNSQLGPPAVPASESLKVSSAQTGLGVPVTDLRSQGRRRLLSTPSISSRTLSNPTLIRFSFLLPSESSQAIWRYHFHSSPKFPPHSPKDTVTHHICCHRSRFRHTPSVFFPRTMDHPTNNDSFVLGADSVSVSDNNPTANNVLSPDSVSTADTTQMKSEHLATNGGVPTVGIIPTVGSISTLGSIPTVDSVLAANSISTADTNKLISEHLPAAGGVRLPDSSTTSPVLPSTASSMELSKTAERIEGRGTQPEVCPSRIKTPNPEQIKLLEDLREPREDKHAKARASGSQSPEYDTIKEPSVCKLVAFQGCCKDRRVLTLHWGCLGEGASNSRRYSRSR